MLANRATPERALRCLTSKLHARQLPKDARRNNFGTGVIYIPRETEMATLNFVRYEHPGGWRSALNFVTEV